VSIGQRHLFSWLHLSDMHYGHGDSSYGWDQRTLFSHLEQDIKRAIEEWPELPRVQAIFVTGDIAFSGQKAGRHEYRDANRFLTKIVGMLDVRRDQVFLVPGNHDVQRGEALHLVKRVRRKPRALDDILDARDEREALFARQANYRRFADRFVVRDLSAWSETIRIPSFGDIVLVGLNTALVSNDNEDRGKLSLAGAQRNVLSSANGRVRLLLTHHPFEEGWLDDEGTLRSLAWQRRTVHLCGHIHDPRVELVSQAGGLHHVRVVAAAAHRDQKEAEAGKDSHGYNFGSLMIDAKGALQLRTWPRRWFPKWSSFRVDHLGVPDRRAYDDKPLGEQLPGSGLVLDGPDVARFAGVHWWGEPVVLWNELLDHKRTLEVFGIAVRTLFEQPNSEHVKALLERGGSVHVVLADPRSRIAMARYDQDFERPPGDRFSKVVDVLKLLQQMRFTLAAAARSRLTVALTRYDFKYSAYRIDGDVLFVPLRMIPGKQTKDTPALAFERGSPFVTRYIGREMDELCESANRVTPQVMKDILQMASP
jgi:predicted phosphodiesterase